MTRGNVYIYLYNLRSPREREREDETKTRGNGGLYLCNLAFNDPPLEVINKIKIEGWVVSDDVELSERSRRQGWKVLPTWPTLC